MFRYFREDHLSIEVLPAVYMTSAIIPKILDGLSFGSTVVKHDDTKNPVSIMSE